MKQFSTKIPFKAFVVSATLLLVLGRSVVGQDVKYPAPDEHTPTIVPPLINATAAESHYHRRLFDGFHGLPAVQDIDEIKAELYDCSTTPISS